MTLREFFVDEVITIPFKLWGKTHLFLLTWVVLALGLVIIKRKKIYQLKSKQKRVITLIFCGILFLNMLTLYISSIYYQCFDYKTMLPLHLCYLANYFYIFVVWSRKSTLYPYLWFMPFLGSIPAIIFFDIVSVWESFNFYLYLISHHLFLIMGLITFYMYPKKITYKHVFQLVFVLTGIYLVMIVFNQAFQTNYFFSQGIPSFILEIFPFLRNMPTILILFVMELVIMGILYKFFNKQVSLLTKENVL